MPKPPHVLIYAAACVLGTEQRGGAVCVLQCGEHAKAVGRVGGGLCEQSVAVTICIVALTSLTVRADVLLDVNNSTVAQMANNREALSALAFMQSNGDANGWSRLAQVAARHGVTFRYMKATDSPRMAALAFAARELALAGEVRDDVLEQARLAVLTGRGLMEYSPMRQEMKAWGKV